jgi:hypothetical protein
MLQVVSEKRSTMTARAGVEERRRKAVAIDSLINMVTRLECRDVVPYLALQSGKSEWEGLGADLVLYQVIVDVVDMGRMSSWCLV